jgi:hypothetical protein
MIVRSIVNAHTVSFLITRWTKGANDTQNYDTQNNDTQNNGTQHY